ncbi:MAG: class I SAM-dependent methyltransferase [Methanoregulaceae archaeon]|nr:class I SAM-dependent methyltransferase [Methanoregulaceae archaeon]
MNPQVYSPEADTHLLLDTVLAEVRPGDRVLEVGTGSGEIAAALLEIADVVATDINPHAVKCARERGIGVVRADLLAGIRGPFDLVIFNPPYLPTAPEERMEDWLEYALDGGPDGRAVITRFACDVKRVLAPGGRVLLLISSLTGEREVADLFLRRGFASEVIMREKVSGEELVVMRFREG